MHIRSATPADAHRIATIHVVAWQAAYRHIMPDSVLHRQSVECRKAFWTKELVAGVSRTFVAEDEGGLVGWVNFGACRDADAPANAEVYAIYLDPARLRRGVGSALWHVMLEEVSGDGRRCVTVWVHDDNQPARRFYEAMGGTLDNAKDRYELFGDIQFREIRYWFKC